MISDAITLAAIFATGGLTGYIIGSARGHKRGRDEQWVESLRMSRGTVSERAKRAGMTRHYITEAEVRLLFKNRIGGVAK